jgi:hypothetical protein
LQAKKVTDTCETDELFELLDAVNLFATTGNPKALAKSLKDVKTIPNKTKFVTSIRTFYDTVLCCKISRLDNAVTDLRMGIENVLNAEYEASNAKMLIFRDLVCEIVRAKMLFIFEENYLKSLVKWCCENDYLQQAVTILWEKMLKNPEYERGHLPNQYFEKIRTLRNNFNHADGEEIQDTVDNIKSYISHNILPYM